MTPETFLEEFSTVANAPGGVQRLREMILQLAVQGKLVPQNPEDEPVEILVKKCLVSRQIDFKKSGPRKMMPSLALKPEEIPYPIPNHWQWISFDKITSYIQRGKSPTYDEKGTIRIISQKCVQWSGIDIGSARRLKSSVFNSYGEERILVEGDILWNSTGTGTVGRACIYKKNDGIQEVADSHVTVVRAPHLSPRYIWCFIATPMIQARFKPDHPKTIVSGSTNQVELATRSIKDLPFPLPPLAEQHRIVAKVDQLMALCDRLEAQQKKRTRLVGHTRKTVLEALADAQGREELRAAWQRVKENFGMLFETPEDVEDLKKTILQNAVSGMLTREERFKAKILADVIMFGPRNGLSPLRVDYETKIKVLTLSATTKGIIDLTKFKYAEIDIEDESHLWIENEDILIQRGNSKEYVGVSAIYRGPSKEYIYPDLMMKVKADKNLMLSDYLHICLLSPLARNHMWNKLSGTSSTMPKINKKTVQTVPINLPTIAEQHRIVAKVQSLLALCDGLQSRIAESRTIAGQLAQSIVESITGITTEKQEKMKIPKTELVSRLDQRTG